MQELEKGNISKIVYAPNNAYTENSMEIGFLPGTTLDKTLPSMGPLIDMVGLDKVMEMQMKEELEIVPISQIRGRSFKDAIILVNEAQNLTESHIKLLIARCGEGTRIFFDGDVKQADQAIFKNKSGLKLLPKLRLSKDYAEIFAMVTLKAIERSKTAQAAAYLDNI